MTLRLTEPMKRLLAKEGFEPSLGARPLRRVIQRRIEDPLSEALLLGEFDDGAVVVCDLVGDEAVFHLDGGELESPSELPPAQVTR